MLTPSVPHPEQIHILVGCADARDVGQAHIDAVRTVTQEYAERGIDVAFYSIRVPGTFVTDDVLEDICRIVREREDTAHGGPPASYFVHLQTHGALENGESMVSGSCATRTTHALRIVQGSPLNCGMLGATSVAVELEALILAACPRVTLRSGETLVVKDETALRRLLREVYNHDGFLAGDWVRSIDDLRTHVRSQKAVLERAIQANSDLRRLGIQVTANLHDYQSHLQVRLDCGEVAAPYWDDALAFVQNRLRADNDQGALDREAQSVKQAPDAGMFGTSDPLASPRDLAYLYYESLKRLPEVEYHSNSLFVLSGSSFDRSGRPFGPYALAGFYYAAEHLNVADWVVIGRDAEQTRRMCAKIENDPIASLIVRELKINLLPVSTDSLGYLRKGTAAGRV